MQLLVVILPIMANHFNTDQVLFAKIANQLDHKSGRVTQEQIGKSLSEGCSGSLLLRANCPLKFLTNPSWRQTFTVRIDSFARIFSTKLIISA